METEQARHEAEETLRLKQFGSSRNIPHKLQNGSQCSEGNSLQISEDTNWSHYKRNTGGNFMKRHRENCSSPAPAQGLFDSASNTMNGEMLNGEMTHVQSDQFFLAHQSKKLKADPASFKRIDVINSSLADGFPEFTKAAELQCNLPQTDMDKRNYNVANGDVFGLPRIKQMISNDAVSPPSTIESTPGDLLEKTLSQYYPEQVSIAPQTTRSQLNAVNGSVANNLPNEGAQMHSLTSGLPALGQMPVSEQQPPVVSSNAGSANNYNNAAYVVNGYSNTYGENHHQQQQRQHRPPSYPGQECSQLPGMALSTNTASTSQQHQNGPEYPEKANPLGIFAKANQGFNHNSFMNHNIPRTVAEGRRFGSFPSSRIQRMGRKGESGSGQEQHCNTESQQYGVQSHHQQNASNHDITESIGTIAQALQQLCHARLEHRAENTLQQKTTMSNPQQKSWTDPLHSHQQPQVSSPLPQSQEQDMWGGYAAKQKQTSPQVQKLVQRFQAQGAFAECSQGSNSLHQQKQDGLPTQAHSASTQHNSPTEWQQSLSKTPQMHHLPDQSILPQTQQTEGSYQGNMQSEHLQQQHSHPQRPLSQPLQCDGQQLKSPIYRPHSQPQPCQLPPSQPLRTIFNDADELKQLQQHKLYAPNSSSTNLKQCQPQRPNNHCQPPNHNDFPQSPAQNQPHLPQDVFQQQVHPKSEKQQRASCTHHRGPQLPLASGGPHGDFQRHAALRMHLLERQERQGPPYHPQNPSDSKYVMKAIKIENDQRFEFPCPSQEKQQQLLMGKSSVVRTQIKQEPQESLCDESRRQGSILASMEQSLKQYQLSPVFEKKSIVINSNKVKVEYSGPVTVVSTKIDLKAEETPISTSTSTALKKPSYSTPKKEHLLKSFLDSPMKLLDTPIKNLLDTPLKTQYDIASCHCVEHICEKDEGPYYTHLGAAPSVQGIRDLMEKRSGLAGRAIRIEKVIYTGKEGKSTQGCPIAKWVIRRSSVEEKLLVLVRERNGHKCESACIIVVMLVWEGIQKSLADCLYNELSSTLTKYGAHTQRRCALNEERTCACQGYDPEACGASFSFGCSWSMYYNGCKFARSKVPRKFKLLGDDVGEEERLENNFQNLATILAPLYKTMAPEAYGNQVEHEHRGTDCRLGLKEGRPFSGVTACMDFCAHAHRDLHNMQGGSTVVCTLTREDNREIGKIPQDEQLHVLPLYKASSTDEFGSKEGQQEKIKSGAIQVLSAFRRQVRMLAEPAKSCRQKKLEAKKAAANKNAMLESAGDKAEKAFQFKSKADTFENIAQSTPVAGLIPGAMVARLEPGHLRHQPGIISQHQQHQHSQGIPPTYPGSPNAANFPRYPNHPGSFPSTSKPGNMYLPQPPTAASPYPSPLHIQSSYINGSARPYPGYQCNGGMPLDNYHPIYGSNPKHLDMYRQQRPSPLEQQYGLSQHYNVNYSPRYGEPGLQVNGYNACGMRPVHPMRSPYPYGPNGKPEPQYMDPLARAPSVHGGLNYPGAIIKANQFGGYPNPYVSPSSQILSPGQDLLHSHVKMEMVSPAPQMLSAQLSSECLNQALQSGLPNGNTMGPGIKQEPGTPQTPSTPQKPEMWSDNEHNFLDPDIGGVAVAPSHGSVLIECAKRELHATTPLKNPDRHHPTRISLVFYQHKNLNEAKHGLALWEAKMAEKAREKEEEAERNGGEGTPSKSSKKGVKREHSETTETGEPPYKRFIQSLLEGSLSCTTNTYVSTSPYAFTKVTGPYRQFV